MRVREYGSVGFHPLQRWSIFVWVVVAAISDMASQTMGIKYKEHICGIRLLLETLHSTKGNRNTKLNDHDTLTARGKKWKTAKNINDTHVYHPLLGVVMTPWDIEVN